jgi:hypothetical protein
MTTNQVPRPSAVEDRASEDFAFVEQMMSGKAESEQIEILSRSLRHVLVQQYTVQAENSSLIAERDRLEMALRATQKAIEKGVSACRTALIRTVAPVVQREADDPEAHRARPGTWPSADLLEDHCYPCSTSDLDEL